MHQLRPHTDTAISVVAEALRRAAVGAGTVHAKRGRDVVTDADLAVEDGIRDVLVGAFAWPVIGEERGGDVPASGPYWIVDPICGTRNYASGVPLYAVNVALVEDACVSGAVVGDGSTGLRGVGRGTWGPAVPDWGSAPG